MLLDSSSNVPGPVSILVDLTRRKGLKAWKINTQGALNDLLGFCMATAKVILVGSSVGDNTRTSKLCHHVTLFTVIIGCSETCYLTCACKGTMECECNVNKKCRIKAYRQNILFLCHGFMCLMTFDICCAKSHGKSEKKLTLYCF